MALRDDLVDVFRLDRGQSSEPEVVNDQKIGVEVFFYLLLPAGI
jgi:hypothetical protein